jgi:flagellar biosynthesis protein FliP
MNTNQKEVWLEALEPISTEVIYLRQDFKSEMSELREFISQQSHLQDSLQKELSNFISVIENYSPTQGRRSVQEMKSIAEQISLKTKQIQTALPEEKISHMHTKLENLSSVITQLRKEVHQQSLKLDDFPSWKLVIQMTLVLAFLMASSMFGSYHMMMPSNNSLEKKIDQVNNRNEQIWKKIKK